MPKSREQKSVAIERLTTAFKNAKSVTFADYQGLTVPQVDTLRRKARESDVEYIVAKKTLMTRAAKDAGYDVDTKVFPGMIGAAFSATDEVASAKVLGDMTKDTTLKLVGGIFDGNVVAQDKVLALSKLPGKKELLGMFVYTLNAIPASFVRALNAIREQKEAGAPAPVAAAAPAPAVEEAPAPAASEEAPAAEAPVEPAAEAPAETEAPAA